MKIYTKTGDAGDTGLFAGPRVSKTHARIEAYGEVDELNSLLGWVRALAPPPEIDGMLDRVQHELFALGAELATPAPSERGTKLIGSHHVTQLETEIDRMEAELPPLTQFILPGGSQPAAALHVARTACRRAERRIVSLGLLQRAAEESAEEPLSTQLLAYVNRLSDWLFVIARRANQLAACPEIGWTAPQ